MMPETKKLLVAFHPDTLDPQSSDFLIPWSLDDRPIFHGLESAKYHEFGIMIFLGRAISENDLFAKLIDSGAFIGNVEHTMTALRSYIGQLQELKIGNVIRIVPSAGGTPFRLDLVARAPSGFKQ